MIVGCKNQNNEKDNHEFSNLYNALLQELEGSQVNLKKYIFHNGKVDTIEISSDSIDWTVELKLFKESVISQSAYSDYEIKSLKNGCEKSFHTSENKHPVKNLRYINCNDTFAVYIDVKKMSPLYNFDYHLEINDSGYLIQSSSDVEFAYKSEFRIEGKFIRVEENGRN